MSEGISRFGDAHYQALLADESARGVSDADLEDMGHATYGSDVDTDAQAAQLRADFIEPLEGPLIPRMSAKRGGN